MRAILLVATGTEELEAVSVVDVLRRAQVETEMVAVDVEGCVLCANGIKISTNSPIASIMKDNIFMSFDALIVPGGSKGVDIMCNNKDVIRMVNYFAKGKGKYLAAICAGPLIFNSLEMSAEEKKKIEFTAYPSLEKKIKDFTYKDKDVVVHNNIVTSKGPGTALQFAVEIARLLAPSKADEVARNMLIKM